MATHTLSTQTPNGGVVLYGNSTNPAVGSTNLVGATATAVVIKNGSNTQSTRKGNTTAITSVATSSGFCNFTLSTHGLAVGDVLFISGATAASLNTTHTITSKTSNTFKTDVPFATSAAAGSFRKALGSPNQNDETILTATNTLNGVDHTGVANSGRLANSDNYHPPSLTQYHKDITSINGITGAVTTTSTEVTLSGADTVVPGKVTVSNGSVPTTVTLPVKNPS